MFAHSTQTEVNEDRISGTHRTYSNAPNPEIPMDLTEDDITECTRTGIGPVVAPVEFIHPDDITDESEHEYLLVKVSRYPAIVKRAFFITRFRGKAITHKRDILAYDNVREEITNLRNFMQERGYDPYDVAMTLLDQGMSEETVAVMVSLASAGDA